MNTSILNSALIRPCLILCVVFCLSSRIIVAQDTAIPLGRVKLSPEKVKLKQRAVILEQQGDHAEALKILLSLTDKDYYVPRNNQLCYVIPAHIPATRQLAMMRCHMALSNTSEAVDIAWVVLQGQWVDDHQVKEIIAEETDVQGGTEATRKRLKYLLDKSPKNYMAKDTLAYLELISAAERQDFEYIETISKPVIDASGGTR